MRSATPPAACADAAAAAMQVAARTGLLADTARGLPTCEPIIASLRPPCLLADAPHAHRPAERHIRADAHQRDVGTCPVKRRHAAPTEVTASHCAEYPPGANAALTVP